MTKTNREPTPTTLKWLGRKWRNVESETAADGELYRAVWERGLDRLEAWLDHDSKWSATLHVESGMDAWADLKAGRIATFNGVLAALARCVRRVGKVEVRT